MYKKRRQRLYVSLLAVLMVVGGIGVLMSANPFQRSGSTTVQRAVVPAVAQAPTAQDQETWKPKPPPIKIPTDNTLYLTVPRLGLYDAPVEDSDTEAALDQGAIHLPSTGFPWQKDSNVYIAGHRIGYPGTGSRYIFYMLPALQDGDEIVIKDADGQVYKYRVAKKFSVTPEDVWVTNPVPSQNVVTLQTCTETLNDWWTIGPKLMVSAPDTGRLIVQAYRVS